MNKQKIGNLKEVVIPKGNLVWGDEIDIQERGRIVGRGKIIWFVASGTALMKVIVEIVKWFGN